MEDLIRIGFVSSVNKTEGTVQVTYQDRDRMVTSDLPVLAFGGEYALPEVNDMVLVAHLSNDLSSGVVLGKFWSKADLPEKTDWYKRIGENMLLAKVQDTLEIHAPEIKIVCAGRSLTFSELMEKLENME